MKICLPVNENNGLNSTLSEHFGSAPYFMIVDTDSNDCISVLNNNQHHAHGMCRPLEILGHEKFDGIVVGGIGAGALNKLMAAKIKVYKTGYTTIRETVEAFKGNQLVEVNLNLACSGGNGSNGHHCN